MMLIGSLKGVKWFKVLGDAPEAKLRLFCFPYAGAGALIFLPWPDALPDEVEVIAAQLPGHWSRLPEPPFAQLSPLVESLADVIDLYLDKPFAFFGHSMGAMIGFELARQLRRLGRPLPHHLFVSGRRAPQIRETEPPIYDLPDVELIGELRKLNGTPAEVLEDHELMALVLPILRADLSICQTYDYRPEPPLDCPITVFGGISDEEASESRLSAWSEQTTATYRKEMFPGDHFFLHQSQTALLRSLAYELHKLAATV
jgi:surfactin synthase thioesterase subunit